MNKQQAYKTFWNSFGILAFEENSVPDDTVFDTLISSGAAKAKYPYIAYQVLVDDIDNAVFPTAAIYDRSSSWERSDTLANTISASIEDMGAIELDEGYMYITKGTPYAQHQLEDRDLSIRVVRLNLGVEFFTKN